MLFLLKKMSPPSVSSCRPGHRLGTAERSPCSRPWRWPSTRQGVGHKTRGGELNGEHARVVIEHPRWHFVNQPVLMTCSIENYTSLIDSRVVGAVLAPYGE